MDLAIGERQRLVLATIAAHGILGHNTAVPMPEAFTANQLLEILPIEHMDLRDDLDTLTNAELLSEWNTGHKGYGDVWVEGHDTWEITSDGLLVLWGCVPVKKKVART